MKDEHPPDRTGNEENFAQMLETGYKEPVKLEPGQSIMAAIVKITADWVLLEVGGKGEGYLDRKELLDSSGNLTAKEGDDIRAYFLFSENGEMHFTSKIGAGPSAHLQLAQARKSGVEVEGTVSREQKGGFEITISGGARAFCPFSQMGIRREENKESYIGRAFMFDVIECSGRNIVLSRKDILAKERREKALVLKNTLEEGMRIKGVVTSIQKFGAFVDIGGVEGLLPVSEIAWDRTENVGDRLSAGQAVEVVVKKLDWERERISFSLREILSNPWDSAARTWPPGSYHTGTVTRLAPFGAFVALGEGVEGLLRNPEQALKAGQIIEVKVESVDRENKKISLAPADAARQKDEDEAALKKYQQPEPPDPESLGTLGEMLKKQMEKKEKIQGK